jgi:hypothetical protein
MMQHVFLCTSFQKQTNMKKIVQSILLCSIVLVLSITQGRSQSTLVHYWNFNHFASAEYTDTIHAIPADYTTITSRQASILYTTVPNTSSSYSSYIDTLTAETAELDYDTVNLRQGAIGGIMIRARNPSDSMQLLFYIPTTNYKNILLSYGTETSSAKSGQSTQVYAYSLDSGATWKTSGLSIPSTATAPDTTFGRVAISFTDDSVNNNSKLIFRITFSGNNTGTKGNNRFDNVTVDADTIIAPTTSVNTVTANNSIAYTLYPNPVTNNINITSSSENAKTVLISNAAGQTVYMGLESGKQISVNTANLSAGNYFVTIRDNNTNGTQTIKFVKQ